ncbi:thiamine pyrophosphate-dependent dehydrogenase E1 component subunit alpha [Candidatus Pelagibacter sp.]|jgi:pyruvate dehydrogenase E1 component alpha subunit|nr:thiamine pyrophosphate-dependent dehydrogenase E1 component subunit alpha [Candidatus Pelagibacter sp.]
MEKPEVYKDLFYQAMRIRLVEEKIIELYPSDLIQSPVHLSIGQEAVAVGVCANLNSDDWVFINYRGHAFYFAKGGPMPEFFAELMGKKDGQSKGKAGSMHLASPKQGIMGASAVVGSTISHAVGAALMSKIKNENRIFVTNFGDGALEQGVFHESLNFASLNKVRILFLCEDNNLAVHSPKSERQSFSLESLVASYGIPFYEIEEGYDFLKVQQKSKIAIDDVRNSNRPVFLKINTARYKEHVGPGEDFSAGYRNESEMNKWKKLDPLMTNKELYSEFLGKINKEIEDAVKFGIDSPLPDKKELLSDV